MPPAVTVHHRLLATLRCPRCAEPLTEAGGRVACQAGHQVRDGGGWLDLESGANDAVTDRTFESFGYEWTAFADIRPEDEGYWLQYTADVPWDQLVDAVGIDVGCGKGRYTRPTARRLAGLVALDGSAAVSAAASNLADEPNTVVIRADLRDEVVADGSFGFVSCLGVLHHLADPQAAFARVARLLAPGGVLLVYLYSRPENRGVRAMALRAATTLRKVTVRVPHRVLRPLCFPVAAVLYGLVVVPGAVGDRWHAKKLTELPLEVYRGSPLRSLWLDTFDRLSAPLENRYVWEDIRPWVEAAGLEVVAVRTWGGLMITARAPKDVPQGVA